MTVEDPIEYYIDGIGQTQVNTRVEMTFARGLRAILRQDPDVVMVGEIRDLETAQIAVQASLTGHLVLSTLHTNTAVGAVTRLRDMGVEPFLLSSSLVGVLAQRLVRVLNPATREAYTAGEYERRLLNLPDDAPSPTLYRAGARDPSSGYQGPHRHLRAGDGRRAHAHDDPRRRVGAWNSSGTRAPARRASATTAAPRCCRASRRSRKSSRSRARTDAASMGAFEYVAVDAAGRERKGVLEGDTPRHVRQLLREQSLLPVAVKRGHRNRRRARVRRRLALRPLQRGLSAADLVAGHAAARDAGQVGAAARGGAARRFAADRQAARPQRHARRALAASWKATRSPTAWPSSRARFPEIYRATIAASEQSGPSRLGARAAGRLHRESRRSCAAARSARCSTRCCCSSSASRSSFFLLVSVVPKVVEVFRNSEAELPLLTQALIAGSDFMRAYGVFLVVGIARRDLAVHALAAQSSRTARRWHQFLLAPAADRQGRARQQHARASRAR